MVGWCDCCCLGGFSGSLNVALWGVVSLSTLNDEGELLCNDIAGNNLPGSTLLCLLRSYRQRRQLQTHTPPTTASIIVIGNEITDSPDASSVVVGDLELGTDAASRIAACGRPTLWSCALILS